MSLRVLPSGAETLREADAAVLAALWRVYARDGRATVSTVAEAVPLSRSSTWARLRTLDRLGLVAGTGLGTAAGGSLRPLVWPTAV